MDGADFCDAKESRRRAILDVARDVFLSQGYAAASMAAIAAQVGGSKGTLYNYFPSKESLFAALVQSECRSDLWLTSSLPCKSQDAASALSETGCAFLSIVLSERALRIHRLVIAESGRFPELGRAFYDNGPRRWIELLSDWVLQQSVDGRLGPLQPERAATQFLDLCKAGLHQKRLWNLEPEPSQAEIRANVEAAVAVFLAAYGAPGRR